MLLTETVTDELPTLPAASYARAFSVYEPFAEVVVSHINVAEGVELEPLSAPLRYHSSLVMPTLSAAETLTETGPDTVLPVAGVVMVTVGAVVSSTIFWTETLTALDVPTFPAAS